MESSNHKKMPVQLDSDSAAREMRLEGMSLTVEGSLSRIEDLFHLRETVQCLVEHYRQDNSVKMSELLDIISRFFMAYGMNDKNEDFFYRCTRKIKSLHDSTPTQCITLHMQVPKKKKTCMETNMVKIHDFLKEMLRQRVVVDTYLVLFFLFKFSIERRTDLELFVLNLQGFGSSNEVGAEKSIKKCCAVCSRLERVDLYCGVEICQPCKRFFKAHMRQYSLYTLRCKHPPSEVNSSRGSNTLEQKLDLACRRCRFEKCRQVGMVDEYQHSETSSLLKSCYICQSTKKLTTLCGAELCFECRKFFITTYEQMSQLGLWMNTSNIYHCKNDPKGCKLSATTKLCAACRWKKFEELGILTVFTILNAGKMSFSSPDESKIVCNVCHCDLSVQSKFLGQHVCQLCRAFLNTSMKLYTHQDYCCPEGELDHLCSLPSDIANRCKYCWFRRLELSGLVDRWIIADGNPDTSPVCKIIANIEEEDTDEGVHDVIQEFPVVMPRKRHFMQQEVSNDDSETRKFIRIQNSARLSFKNHKSVMVKLPEITNVVSLAKKQLAQQFMNDETSSDEGGSEKLVYKEDPLSLDY